MKGPAQEEEEEKGCHTNVSSSLLICFIYSFIHLHKCVDLTYDDVRLGDWKKVTEKNPLAPRRPVKCAEHFQAINYVLMICFVLGFGFRFPIRSLLIHSWLCLFHTPSLCAYWTGISICDGHEHERAHCFIITEMKWKTLVLITFRKCPLLLHIILKHWLHPVLASKCESPIEHNRKHSNLSTN